MRAAASAMFGARLGRPVSDERLVARVRAGDSRAFEAIYDRYSRPIHSFCRHLLGQPDDAEDAVQHTFLAAYRGIHRSDQPIDLKPWLFAIARNRCVSVLRARRHDAALAGPGSSPFEPATEGLLAAVERRESLRDLLRDIGTLPEDQRSALILTQLGTLKHQEVARVLGVPTPKVRALVFQARNSLISTRLARETACDDIREQLATLTGGALRRGNLRRHLVSCSSCRDYQVALKRQRAAIVALLPVVAQPLLRQKILAEVAGGAGVGVGATAAAGMGGTAGGLVVNGIALKLGLAATVAATGVGAAVVTGGVHHAFDHSRPASVTEVALVGPTKAARAPSAAGALRQQTRPSNQMISLGTPKHSTSHTPKHRSSHHTAPTAIRTEQADKPSATAPSSPPTGSATPPGLAKQGGTPPGQTKKGSSPPGLAKQGGTPPGQAKKTEPPPAATPPAPASPPGNANGQGNGNAGGNANGQAQQNSNAGGNGKGNGP